MELLIALTLVAVLLVGMVTSNSNLIHAIRGADTIRSDVENIYTTFDLFEKDILAVTPGSLRAKRDKYNENIFILDFSRTMPKTGPYIKNGSTISVQYTIETINEQTYIYRKVFDPKFSIDTEKMLLSKQNSISVKFIETHKNKKGIWSSNRMPAAIKLEFTDAQNKVWHRTFPILVRDS